MSIELKTLEDGRRFPQLDGETLSWSMGLYHTLAEEQKDFPKMRAVVQAMLEHRPEDVERERREMVKGSFNRVFGHNAKVALKVIEEELKKQVTA